MWSLKGILPPQKYICVCIHKSGTDFGMKGRVPLVFQFICMVCRSGLYYRGWNFSVIVIMPVLKGSCDLFYVIDFIHLFEVAVAKTTINNLVNCSYFLRFKILCFREDIIERQQCYNQVKIGFFSEEHLFVKL